MIGNVVNSFDRIMRKYTPDPFIFALLLTFIAYLLGVTLTESTPGEMLKYWGEGFWQLIAFTLQMVMILVGGYVMATAPAIKLGLKKLVSYTKTPKQAVVVTTLVSCLAAWINWGFGLVVGALVALEMARQIRGVNFRVLVASAYSGFLLWHGGLSGSIPLLLNTEGNFSQEWLGRTIPLSETLFSPFNIAAVISLLVLLPALNLVMSSHTSSEAVSIAEEPASEPGTPITFADKLEYSPWLGRVTGLFGMSFVFYQIAHKEFTIDLNQINFLFLFFAILLHGSSRSFLTSVKEAASKVGPILIQYPFYAGIMSMLTMSGLAAFFSAGFMDIANATTFPVFTFLSAGLVNFFVPSGGGQWAVQAPVILPAAQTLGADMAKSIMAVAWGDAWTNLAQPFWALPLLAIAGLKIRDIMGYCLLTLVASGVLISALLLIF